MIDTKLLDLAVQDLRNLLRDGLLATDIWDRSDGLSLAGHNQQAVAVALFTRMMDMCDPRTGATDYTLQASVFAIVTGAAGVCSGFSARALGYAGHFALAALLAAAALVVVIVRLPSEAARSES